MTVMITSKPRVVIALLASLLPASSLLAQDAAIAVRDAWIRESTGGRPVTAAFLILENKSGMTRALVRGTASVGDTLELHEMKRDNGMMRMSPVGRIEIPAHSEVALKPGGLHLMIFGLKAPVTATDTVALTLIFDDGETVAVKAPVRPMKEMP